LVGRRVWGLLVQCCSWSLPSNERLFGQGTRPKNLSQQVRLPKVLQQPRHPITCGWGRRQMEARMHGQHTWPVAHRFLQTYQTNYRPTTSLHSGFRAFHSAFRRVDSGRAHRRGRGDAGRGHRRAESLSFHSRLPCGAGAFVALSPCRPAMFCSWVGNLFGNQSSRLQPSQCLAATGFRLAVRAKGGCAHPASKAPVSPKSADYCETTRFRELAGATTLFPLEGCGKHESSKSGEKLLTRGMQAWYGGNHPPVSLPQGDIHEHQTVDR